MGKPIGCSGHQSRYCRAHVSKSMAPGSPVSSLEDTLRSSIVSTYHASEAAKDGAGKTQLYSIDHADLFVSNIRTSLVEKLLRGIPHSLVLQNSNSELQILVPSLRPVRPAIGSSPFSVELVIDRSDDAWLLNCDTNYYL